MKNENDMSLAAPPSGGSAVRREGRVDWKPIRKACTDAAEKMGHRLEGFRSLSAPYVKTTMCEMCFGCCWIAYTPTRGFTAGGRLLKYRCGTPEAAGLVTEPARGADATRASNAADSADFGER